jgi:cytochrome c-type biogenesis protein CcmH/NrfF
MAPCCWSGTVADHGHSEMESSIREMVSQGLTRQQVLDKFVAIYGEKILAIPKAEGFNLTAWIMPAVVFVLGVFIMILYFTNRPAKVALTQQKQNIRHSDQIEQELMEMD